MFTGDDEEQVEQKRPEREAIRLCHRDSDIRAI